MARSSRSLQAYRNVPERSKAPVPLEVPSVEAAIESGGSSCGWRWRSDALVRVPQVSDITKSKELRARCPAARVK